MRGGVVGPRVSRGGHLSEGEEDRGRGDACVQPCVFARSRVSARLDQPAPRGFSRRRRARAPPFVAQMRARETARGRPHLRISPRPSSLATMVSSSTRFLAALVVAAWAFASRPARARRSTSRRPTSTSACPPRSRGRTRCPSRTSARRSTVPPSCASSRDVAPLFRERAPRSRPDARPLRTTRSDDLFFLSPTPRVDRAPRSSVSPP